MPTKEQITSSICGVLKISGVELSHPTAWNGAVGDYSKEASARFYIDGRIKDAMTQARSNAGETWPYVRTGTTPNNYNEMQTQAIFGVLKDIVVNGQGVGADNLRRIGINEAILTQAYEDLFKQEVSTASAINLAATTRSAETPHFGETLEQLLDSYNLSPEEKMVIEETLIDSLKILVEGMKKFRNSA